MGDVVQSQAGQPALLREINERTVYQTIRERYPVSRAEVARQTGLSKPTVSLALRTLEASDLVTACGHDDGGPGRAAVLYQPVPHAALGIGISIDVGRVHGALVDLDGKRVDEANHATTSGTARSVYAAVVKVAERLARPGSSVRERLASVVVGTPGVIHPHSGLLTQAGILPGLDGTRPADHLSSRLGVPVTALNDVDLAALAEQAMGPGRDSEHVAVVWIGTGLGAALVLNGELYGGHRGAAGEIIDVPFGPAAIALGATPRAVGTLDPSNAGSGSRTRPREELAQRIAWYVSAIAAVADPELVVLAGPIGADAELAAAVTGHLNGLLSAPPHLLASALGDESVLLGACALASRHAVTTAFDRRALDRSA